MNNGGGFVGYDLQYKEYRRSQKLSTSDKHVDGPWFWGKYSAHPYVGCRSDASSATRAAVVYLGRRDPDTFDTLIQVKLNAVELLRRELVRWERDVIACGDWQQPAEDRYRLSRRMLEVVRDLNFPLFIVETLAAARARHGLAHGNQPAARGGRRF